MHNADAPTHYQGRCDNGHSYGLTTWCPTELSSNDHHMASGSTPARYGKREFWRKEMTVGRETSEWGAKFQVLLPSDLTLILCYFLGASGASQRKVFLRPQGRGCTKPIPNRSGKLGKGNYSPEWATWLALRILEAQPHREQYYHLSSKVPSVPCPSCLENFRSALGLTFPFWISSIPKSLLLGLYFFPQLNPLHQYPTSPGRLQTFSVKKKKKTR